MPKTCATSLPCVLAIGGLDPGGGAGVLADARAIARAGAFACASVAVLTVQSTSGMRVSTPIAARELTAECTEVLAHQRVRAFKVGALGSAENTRAVVELLARHPNLPAVIDPVFMPSRGSGRLLEAKAIAVMRDELLPRAALVTVNTQEAAELTGRQVSRLDEARDAARALLDLGCRAVLLKGGHLGDAQAVDLLAMAAIGRRGATDATIAELTAPRLDLHAFHGGGCVLASLVAGRIAMEAKAYATTPEHALSEAVAWAKRIHFEALKNLRDVGGDQYVLVL